MRGLTLPLFDCRRFLFSRKTLLGIRDKGEMVNEYSEENLFIYRSFSWIHSFFYFYCNEAASGCKKK
jgi:hypothetical protein